MSIKVESTTEIKAAVESPKGDLAQESVVEEQNPASADETVDETTENSGTLESKSLDEESEESDESKDDESQAKDEKAQKKNSNGFKRRIDKLNSKISAEQKEKEFWKQEALKSRQAEPEVKAKETSEKPAVEGKPKSEDFETHEEWVEAVADWKFEQKLSAQEAKQREVSLKTERQSMVDKHIERVQSFAETREDFHELMESVDDIPMSVTVQHEIITSENGPELMYELAKNREEYKRICNLPALAAARELGRFEASLKKSDTPAKEVKKTKAPPPISPVGTASTGSGKKSIFDPTLSQSEYERLRKEQAKRA